MVGPSPRSESGRDVGPQWLTAAVHICAAPEAPARARPLLHTVLAPARPGQTPLTDIRDAGYEVVAVGVFPSEVPWCEAAGSYPQCQHLLLRRQREV